MKYFACAIIAALLFVSFDHMMRVDQQNQCERDLMDCPSGLWIWESF